MPKNNREVTAEFRELPDGRKIITVSGLPGDGSEFTPAGLADLAKILSDAAKSAKQSQITKAVRNFDQLKG